jgi:palmitoyltransferase
VIPRGTRPLVEKPVSKSESSPSKSDDSSKQSNLPSQNPETRKFLDRQEVRDGLMETPPGLEQFYSKEVFICGTDGVPRFCNECWNWKPDRSHHSSELNRCVRRYDHFCPWVGGAVSETNNKFFTQFSIYATAYCIFVFAVALWALLKTKSDCSIDLDCLSWAPNANILAGIILSGVFGMMGVMILLRFGWLVTVNQSTIEQFSLNFPHYSIAVRINESELPRRTQVVGPETPPPFWVIPYPFPSLYGHNLPSSTMNGATTEQKKHLYAIIQPEKGLNIWNLGYYRNIQSIMGEHIWDWFLPLKASPCLKHDYEISDFELGHEFRELEKKYFPHRYDGSRRLVSNLDGVNR